MNPEGTHATAEPVREAGPVRLAPPQKTAPDADYVTPVKPVATGFGEWRERKVVVVVVWGAGGIRAINEQTNHQSKADRCTRAARSENLL